MDKGKFFDAVKLKTAIVPIEGFGDIEVHELSLLQRVMLKDIQSEKQDIARAKVVVMGCDSFDDSDIDRLTSIKSEPLLKLFLKVIDLSGLADGDDSKKS